MGATANSLHDKPPSLVRLSCANAAILAPDFDVDSCARLALGTDHLASQKIVVFQGDVGR
jgi:hypothetical protein